MMKTEDGIKEKVTDTKRLLGVALIMIGSLVFILNYERQTIDLATLPPGQGIIDYYAPQWDPWSHHVKIWAETTNTLMVKTSISGDEKRSLSFTLGTREKIIDVYPGETISIAIENPLENTGSVKTLLWCDSWNYASGILILSGAALLVLNRLRPGVQDRTGS